MHTQLLIFEDDFFKSNNLDDNGNLIKAKQVWVPAHGRVKGHHRFDSRTATMTERIRNLRGASEDYKKHQDRYYVENKNVKINIPTSHDKYRSNNPIKATRSGLYVHKELSAAEVRSPDQRGFAVSDTANGPIRIMYVTK